MKHVQRVCSALQALWCVSIDLKFLLSGAHVLLAPTVNTQRSPLGGRGFESFSEDPLLSGTLAAEYIKGVQSQKVAATIKHFVANDQEFERFSVSSKSSARSGFRRLLIAQHCVILR